MKRYVRVLLLGAVCALLTFLRCGDEKGALAAPSVVLYDQTANAAAFGDSSQDFETSFDGFDDFAADDFVVPAATAWSLTQVFVGGQYFNGVGPAPSVNVWVYPDATGAPGATATCTYTGVAPTTDTAGDLTLDLPSACVLAEGTYWLVVQARMDFSAGGEWGWRTTNTNTAIGTAAKWQNPGNSFGTGCTTWTNHQTCIPGSAGADYLFKLTGSTIAAVPTTATTVSGAPNPSVFGQSFTATAHVTTSTGVLSGSVNFSENGTPLAVNVPVNGSGDASFSTATFGAGDHTITAVYSGDPGHLSSQGQYTQTVNKADTTTALSVSPNPAAFGQTITLTATVTANAPGAGVPGGTVVFTDNGNPIGSPSLDGAGQATLNVPGNLAPGSHTFVATYGGDANFNGSQATSPLETVTTAQTSTTLASSANPSAVGQSVTFTATVAVTPPGGGRPTGTVAFLDNGAVIGSGTVDVSGHASFTTSSLAAGTHPITASYSGNTDFEVSTSAVLSQVVNTNAVGVTVTSSLNPSAPGDNVTFTATVTSGSGTPTGTIAWTDGATPLGTTPLSAGVATFATSTLTTGTHTITGTYSGDGTFTGGESGNVVQVVSTATTTTTLASSANPSTSGQNVTFTATVSSSTAGTISGDVTFKDGTTTLGTTTISGGAATFSTSGLAMGTHSITATYAGDTSYAGSTSAALNQVVNQPADAGPPDSGPPDSGPVTTPDGGRDAAVADSGGSDSGGSDSGGSDSGSGLDSGSGSDGAVATDSGAGNDAGKVPTPSGNPNTDAGLAAGNGTEGGGCGCTTAGAPGSGLAAFGALFALGLMVARRRRRRG